MSSQSLIRIGELSRRVGISTDRLRAWERRYELLRPVRTPGGFRLYSGDDERRVRAMQRHLAAGSSAAEAAAAALADDGSVPRGSAAAAGLRGELDAALGAFDAARAHAVLDQLFAGLGVDETMRAVIFPLLRDLGERWARAEIDVSEEHFASTLLQARLLALLRSSSRRTGPTALLACAPGELHTFGLVAFGIALQNRGWQTTYLGADTPIVSLRVTAARIDPTFVVVTAATPARLAGIEGDLRDLAGAFRVALAGAGADLALAERVGALLLDADPVTAAAILTAGDAVLR